MAFFLHYFYRMRIFLLISASLLLLQSISVAQDKLEHEYRIKLDEVPQEAKSFISARQPDRKVKWYYEESLEGHSVEAKFKDKTTRYSIEFDSLGVLEDLEYVVKKKSLSNELVIQLDSELLQTFEKVRFGKIQVQFSGDAEAVLAAYQDQKADVIRRYEIMIHGKDEHGTHLYETTFSWEGKLLNTRKVVARNTDHLEY